LSKKFGALRQIAFVVPDIDDAMKYWSNTLGVGPFFVKRRMHFETFVYRNQETPSPCISIALANSGDQQIELIAQHDDNPSIYLESLISDMPSFHHVSSWLNSEDFDAARTRLIDVGVQIAQECKITGSGVRLIYWATDNDPFGLFFEISDLESPEHRERVEGMRSAAKLWDGQYSVIEVDR